eukprot:358524-Prorocentrum_minimum.AAC.1
MGGRHPPTHTVIPRAPRALTVCRCRPPVDPVRPPRMTPSRPSSGPLQAPGGPCMTTPYDLLQTLFRPSSGPL